MGRGDKDARHHGIGGKATTSASMLSKKAAFKASGGKANLLALAEAGVDARKRERKEAKDAARAEAAVQKQVRDAAASSESPVPDDAPKASKSKAKPKASKRSSDEAETAKPKAKRSKVEVSEKPKAKASKSKDSKPKAKDSKAKSVTKPKGAKVSTPRVKKARRSKSSDAEADDDLEDDLSEEFDESDEELEEDDAASVTVDASGKVTKRKKTPAEVAQKEIAKHQKSTKLSIPVQPFQRMVRGFTDPDPKAKNGVVLYSAGSLITLQAAVEHAVYVVLRDANAIAQSRAPQDRRLDAAAIVLATRMKGI